MHINLGPGPLKVVLAGVCLSAWMLVSSALIILNRHIMVDLGFRYPFTVSGMGMVASAVLSFLCFRVFKLFELTQKVTLEFWLKNILIIGLFSALTLWTGNEVYLYLSVSFIQMLKSFTPVITMVCLYIASQEVVTKSKVASVAITTAGTAAAAYGEVNMSWVGMLLMFSSETCEAIKLTLMQSMLTNYNFSGLEGVLYFSPATSIFLIIGAAVKEVPKIRATGGMDIVFAHYWVFACAAVMGYVCNVLSNISIKLSSSLSLKVLGCAKNALLVMFCVVFLAEKVTFLQFIGYAISSVGFMWYTLIKGRQIAQSAEPASPKAPLVKGSV